MFGRPILACTIFPLFLVAGFALCASNDVDPARQAVFGMQTPFLQAQVHRRIVRKGLNAPASGESYSDSHDDQSEQFRVFAKPLSPLERSPCSRRKTMHRASDVPSPGVRQYLSLKGLSQNRLKGLLQKQHSNNDISMTHDSLVLTKNDQFSEVRQLPPYTYMDNGRAEVPATDEASVALVLALEVVKQMEKDGKPSKYIVAAANAAMSEHIKAPMGKNVGDELTKRMSVFDELMEIRTRNGWTPEFERHLWMEKQ